MIAAGRLIHLVSIEIQSGKTQSASGDIKPVWTQAETAYAEIKPLHGRNVEIALARTKGKTVSHQVMMRFNPLLVPVTSRIVFQDRIFEIFSAINVLERSIDSDVLCNEVII